MFVVAAGSLILALILDLKNIDVRVRKKEGEEKK